MNKEENKYIDLNNFNLNNDDLFGRYCDIEMLFYGSEGNQYHRFKIIGQFKSNYYHDVPFNEYTKPAYIHDKCVNVVNVIHCGIDESKVYRVSLNDIKILPNELDIANEKLDKINKFMQETAKVEAEHGFFDGAEIHIFAQLQSIIGGE